MRYVNRLSTITPHQLEYNHYPYKIEDSDTYLTMKVTAEDDDRVKLTDFTTEQHFEMSRQAYERHLGVTLFEVD